MSLKTKVTSLITTFILLCSLLTVGVFAVKNTTFNVGGNIEFNVQGIEATITRGATTGFTADKTIGNAEGNILSDIQLNNDMSAQDVEDEFAPWSGLNLAFSDKVATIKLTITNTADEGSDNYLDITALADATTKNNAKVSVVNDAGGITALLAPKDSASFTITFSVINEEYSASLEGFSVNFDMQKKVLTDFPKLSADMTYETFKFTLNNDDTMKIKDIGAENYNTVSTGSIAIPAYVVYEGKPYKVSIVENEAFAECDGLESIIIPNTITTIGAWSFIYSGLTSVTIPDSVTIIGESAFQSCNNLISATIGNGVTSIENDAFMDCENLTNISLGNEIISIGETAFENCGITTLILPDNLINIESDAFSGCIFITSLIIPDSVKSIGEGVFYACKSLTSIVVESGNSVYDSRNNCNALIETATNTLIAGCQNTVIPNTVEAIADSAFSYCTNLTSITIPKSVTSIGRNAFSLCENLTTVNYRGTEEQWNALLENIGSGNDYLKNATLVPNYTGE